MFYALLCIIFALKNIDLITIRSSIRETATLKKKNFAKIADLLTK